MRHMIVEGTLQQNIVLAEYMNMTILKNVICMLSRVWLLI